LCSNMPGVFEQILNDNLQEILVSYLVFSVNLALSPKPETQVHTRL
jgi:hypothetical protein